MDKEKSTQFMLKLVGDVGTALAAGLLLVGDRSGLFKAMAGAGMLSADALADRAGVAPRYVEEWLAVMTGAGYVEHDAAADTFMLPEEHALFLTDDSSEYYLGGLFQSLPGLLAMTPRLVERLQDGRRRFLFRVRCRTAALARGHEPHGLRASPGAQLAADDARRGGAPASRRTGPRCGLRYRRGSDHLGEGLPDRDCRRARSRRALDRHRARPCAQRRLGAPGGVPRRVRRRSTH